jgi:putative tryptophan/tyrosine transport system substrate-binding protein
VRLWVVLCSNYIGFLGSSTAVALGRWLPAFVQRLHDLGWVEGRTVAIEYRWAEGRSERATEIAAEFVGLKVDVIVTSGAAIYAAKQATAVIPIVFAVANDPVGTGLVTSLARPSGNVTGLSLQAPDLASKRLEFLREVVPALRRCTAYVASWHTASNRCGAKVRKRSERSRHAESVGSGLI